MTAWSELLALRLDLITELLKQALDGLRQCLAEPAPQLLLPDKLPPSWRWPLLQQSLQQGESVNPICLSGLNEDEQQHPWLQPWFAAGVLRSSADERPTCSLHLHQSGEQQAQLDAVQRMELRLTLQQGEVEPTAHLAGLRLQHGLYLYLDLYQLPEAAKQSLLQWFQGLADWPWLSSPVPFALLARQADVLTVDEAAYLLQAAPCKLDVLRALPADLLARQQQWDEAQLKVWRELLWQAWQHYFPADDALPLCLRFADWAWTLADWGLLRRALHAALQCYQVEPDWLLALAQCEAACGRLARAGEHLTWLRNDFPDYLIEPLLLQGLAQRQATQAALCPAVRDESNLLSLEPLHADHAAAFAWQYRDPQIAALVDLPALAGEEQVLQWIVYAQEEKGRRDFAVMHAEEGFIGVVSYCRDDADCAFISFWLGCDFQGRGYAKPAVRLLLAQALDDGLKALFTSTLLHNLRSQRCLLGVGFQTMQLPLLAGDDAQQTFFHLPLVASSQAAWPQLQALCNWLECPLSLAIEEQSQPEAELLPVA